MAEEFLTESSPNTVVVRQVMFGVLCAMAAAVVVYGVGMIYLPAGVIAAGVLLAVFAWLMLGDVT